MRWRPWPSRAGAQVVRRRERPAGGARRAAGPGRCELARAGRALPGASAAVRLPRRWHRSADAAPAARAGVGRGGVQRPRGAAHPGPGRARRGVPPAPADRPGLVHAELGPERAAPAAADPQQLHARPAPRAGGGGVPRARARLAGDGDPRRAGRRSAGGHPRGRHRDGLRPLDPRGDGLRARGLRARPQGRRRLGHAGALRRARGRRLRRPCGAAAAHARAAAQRPRRVPARDGHREPRPGRGLPRRVAPRHRRGRAAAQAGSQRRPRRRPGAARAGAARRAASGRPSRAWRR